MKLESAIFNQVQLLGIDWPADVRLVFKGQRGFDLFRDRCSDAFGEVYPKERDCDWSMSNDQWAWAIHARHTKRTWGRKLRLGFALERAEREVSQRVIVLRHRSMLSELGIKERKEWIKT